MAWSCSWAELPLALGVLELSVRALLLLGTSPARAREEVAPLASLHPARPPGLPAAPSEGLCGTGLHVSGALDPGEDAPWCQAWLCPGLGLRCLLEGL